MFAWARFTDDVNLLEIRDEYMRGGERLDVDLFGALARISPVVFPAVLEVYGEGRSGGFASKYVVDVNSGDDPLEAALNLEVLGMFIIGVVVGRSTGVLYGDGIIGRLNEPVTRLNVILRPLRLPNTVVRLFFTDWWLVDDDELIRGLGAPRGVGRENTILVEGDAVKRVYACLHGGCRTPRDYTALVLDIETRRGSRLCSVDGEQRRDVGLIYPVKRRIWLEQGFYKYPGFVLAKHVKGLPLHENRATTLMPYPGQAIRVDEYTCRLVEIKISPWIREHFL